MGVKNPAVLAIILVNVAVFAWMFEFRASAGSYTAMPGICLGLFGIPKVGRKSHGLADAIFVERESGGVWLVILYLLAGLGGTFIQGYYIPTRVFGASAAAFGFIGTFIVLYVSNYKHAATEFVMGKKKLGLSHYLFVVSLLSLTVLLHRVFTNPDIRIGDVAHYWGFAIASVRAKCIRISSRYWSHYRHFYEMETRQISYFLISSFTNFIK